MSHDKYYSSHQILVGVDPLSPGSILPADQKLNLESNGEMKIVSRDEVNIVSGTSYSLQADSDATILAYNDIDITSYISGDITLTCNNGDVNLSPSGDVSLSPSGGVNLSPSGGVNLSPSGDVNLSPSGQITTNTEIKYEFDQTYNIMMNTADFIGLPGNTNDGLLGVLTPVLAKDNGGPYTFVGNIPDSIPNGSEIIDFTMESISEAGSSITLTLYEQGTWGSRTSLGQAVNSTGTGAQLLTTSSAVNHVLDRTTKAYYFNAEILGGAPGDYGALYRINIQYRNRLLAQSE